MRLRHFLAALTLVLIIASVLTPNFRKSDSFEQDAVVSLIATLIAFAVAAKKKN